MLRRFAARTSYDPGALSHFHPELHNPPHQTTLAKRASYLLIRILASELLYLPPRSATLAGVPLESDFRRACIQQIDAAAENFDRDKWRAALPCRHRPTRWFPRLHHALGALSALRRRFWLFLSF
jgi:hypothetical protein